MVDRFESLLSLFGDDVTVRWLITVLHFLWQGALVGGVVAITGRLLRGASARLRYALYSAALLSLPVCVVITFCVVDVPASLRSSSLLESSADIPAKSSALPSQATAKSAVVPMETAEATDAPLLSDRVVKNAVTMKAVANDNSESLSHSSLPMLSRAAPAIAVAYVFGVACFLLRLLTALWGGHRLRTGVARVTNAKLLKLIADQADRVKLKCVPMVAYCERVAVPTVVGVLRPIVLLPVPLMTGLTPEDFAAIIRHELAHIRRYDLWMNLLQRVIESLLFFHPVVWVLRRRLRAAREVCCADLVVSSGCEPMHYAGALLRMAELCAISRQPHAIALAATGDKQPLLERRIERLMNWSNTPRLQLTRAGMAGLLITVVSLFVVPGIAHTWAQAQAPTGNAALENHSDTDTMIEQLKQQCTTVYMTNERDAGGNPRRLTGLDLWGASEGALQTVGRLRGLRNLSFVASDLRAPAFDEVSKLTSLNTLTTVNCRLRPSQLETIGKLTSLEHLELQFTVFGDTSAQRKDRLGQLTKEEQERYDDLLKRNPSKLHIVQAVLLTDRMMPHLGKLTKLRTLKLINTFVSPSSLGHLEALTAMRTLEISPFEMTPGATRYLQGMSRLRKLRYFNADDEIIAELAKIKSLEDLDIWSGEVTDTGALQLAKLTNLERLEIRGNHITDEGLKILSQLPRLKYLDLKYSERITPAAIAHFREQKPNCEVKTDHPKVEQLWIRIEINQTNGQTFVVASDSKTRETVWQTELPAVEVSAENEGQVEVRLEDGSTVLLHAASGATRSRKLPLVTGETSEAAATGKLHAKDESAQSLFKKWQDSARINGKIPGGALGSLARAAARFIKHNPTDERAPKLAELLKRIDMSRDWTQPDALALLDDVTAIYANLPKWAERADWFSIREAIRAGQPLPAELENAPWGKAQPNGLRAAWLLDPRAQQHRLNTPLKSRILFHNAGKNSVVFRVLTWNQSSGHKARDAKGAAIKIDSTYWTTIPQIVACRLAPGEYTEVTGAGIGVGANKDREDWRGTRVGAWIEAKEGDEVTFTPDTVSADGNDGRARPLGEFPWWLAFITNRLNRDAPLPGDAAERKRLLDRAIRDLFGTPPSSEENVTFLSDRSPNAMDALAKRLARRAGATPFTGTLQSGETRFRVLPVDPEAAKKPRVATGPGRYTLGEQVRLAIVRKSDGKRRVNEANIVFFSSNSQAELPGKPHEIKLPDGYHTWAIAWERGSTVLWAAEKGVLHSYDFTTPAQVKETRIETADITNVPEPLREALRPALEDGSNASAKTAATPATE